MGSAVHQGALSLETALATRGIDGATVGDELNRIGYQGPLSVEWEDSGMDRDHGAREACQFVKRVDFQPSGRAFDASFDKEKQK